MIDKDFRASSAYIKCLESLIASAREFGIDYNDKKAIIDNINQMVRKCFLTKVYLESLK